MTSRLADDGAKGGLEPGDSPGPLDATLLFLEELERRNVSLEQANRDLQHFAQVAAHDLRSPMTIVRGYLEQVLRHDANLSSQTREWLTLAHDATGRVVDLVQALLSLSTATGTDLLVTSVSLTEVFEEARSRLPAARAESGAEVTIAPMPSVRGDRALLTVVAQNLLDNALKFARAGVAPVVEVTSHVRTRDIALAHDVCVVRVRDNGIGIAPSDRDHVFTMFGRGGGANRDGHGIGLATCARIVQRHHGTLRIVDIEGPGTSIEIELPALPG